MGMGTAILMCLHTRKKAHRYDKHTHVLKEREGEVRIGNHLWRNSETFSAAKGQ